MLHRFSPCKINLLLNILGKRSDGFHELETLFLPVPLNDELSFKPSASNIHLQCSHPELPVDSGNLVFRAAQRFFTETGISSGIDIHLVKKVPLAAGLGGGSSNAANTLLALNELFDFPLSNEQLNALAANLGSDVPFFMQDKPALGLGRGEIIKPLESAYCLKGAFLLLIHPGFGISTAWAYQELAKHPTILNGEKGLVNKFIETIQHKPLTQAGELLYNSLEYPAFTKFPILKLFQDYLRQLNAVGTLMSGSGSTTFALFENKENAEIAQDKFLCHFGIQNWTAIVQIS